MAENVTRNTDRIEAYQLQLQAGGRLTPVVQEAIAQATNVREDYDIIWYIGGALTGVSDATKERYAHTAIVVNTLHSLTAPKMFAYAPHVNGTDPVKHPDVTPNEVRDIDYLWAVKAADRHFNFWQPTAHGNAIEEGWAEEHDIPATYLTERDARLSRLVLGMHNIAHTIIYDDFMTDGLSQVNDYLDELSPQLLPE